DWSRGHRFGLRAGSLGGAGVCGRSHRSRLERRLSNTADATVVTGRTNVVRRGEPDARRTRRPSGSRRDFDGGVSVAMLEIAGVSKTYRGMVTALSGVSLHLGAGEFVAVRGPSGCGKTTLLLTAGGLLRPDAGRVSVSESNLYALGDEARARF